MEIKYVKYPHEENKQQLKDLTHFEQSYQFVTDITEDTIHLVGYLITCTDFITDKLMYPDKVITNLFPTKDPLDLSDPKLFYTTKDTQQFVDCVLPILHQIEKANKFRRSKVTVLTKNQLIIECSPHWFGCTLRTSLFLKILRSFNFMTKETTLINALKTSRIWDEFLFKIAFSGNLRKVNRYCRYKHGYSTANGGSHSNNGIQFTMFAFNQYKNPPKTDADPWTKARYESAIRNNLRIKNLLVLEEQLKGITLDEMLGV